MNEAVEHVSEEAHFWMARYRTIMVVVHSKLDIDGGNDVWLVEIGEDIRED